MTGACPIMPMRGKETASISLRDLDEVIDIGAHDVGLLCQEGKPREGCASAMRRAGCMRWAA